MAALRFIAVFKCANETEKEDGSEQAFRVSEELSELAAELTPRIERVELAGDRGDGLVLEATPRREPGMLERLETLDDARLASAASRTSAVLAALAGHRGRIEPRRQKAFLAQLPLEALEWIESGLDRRQKNTFLQWGVRTLGDLAALPENRLASRLGAGGALLQRLARGEDLRPFRTWAPLHPFEEHRDLDWTLDSLEPLSFALDQMLQSLCRRLESRGLAAEALSLRLGLDDGDAFQRTLHLAFPLRSAKVLHSLLRLDLQSRSLEAGITSLTVRIQPAPSRTLQYSLLQEAVADPEKLSRTLARLTALAGEDKVGCPKLLDTHRPDAVALAPLKIGEKTGGKGMKAQEGEEREGQAQGVLRRMRPPRPVEIRRQDLKVCAGPWRSSGEWWLESEWDRESWDLELKGGALIRVFRDPQGGPWHLEGIYD